MYNVMHPIRSELGGDEPVEHAVRKFRLRVNDYDRN